jgi:hypothetical protein
MHETLWPRLRTLLRSFSFLIGLVVVGWGVWSILTQPALLFTSQSVSEPTHVIATELSAIVIGFMWMLLITKI